MKKYPSKISYGLLIFILTVLVGATLPLVFEPVWFALLINTAVTLFVTHLYLNTYYTIDNGLLKVKSGMIINKEIEIHTITRIAETKTIISAPALSFDRLEITYKKSSSVVISPKEKALFIRHLLQLNPQIELAEQD